MWIGGAYGIDIPAHWQLSSPAGWPSGLLRLQRHPWWSGKEGRWGIATEYLAIQARLVIPMMCPTGKRRVFPISGQTGRAKNGVVGK
jgi:hypothetical protein